MSLTKDIYTKTNIPVGRTTLRHLLLAFILFSIPFMAFAFVANEVIEGETLPYDNSILMSIYRYSSVTLDATITTITNLGGATFVVGCMTAIAGVLLWRKKWQSIVQLTFGVLGAGAWGLLLKLLFERDRPDLWTHLVTETTYSFPSGHAMMSAALAFSLVAILWHTKWRWTAIIVGGIYMIIIGLTRLYLGVHYPTDVVAGWLISFAWVILVGAILGAVQPRKLFKKLRSNM